MIHSEKYCLAGMGHEDGFVAGAALRMPIKCLLDLEPVQAPSSGALICFSPGKGEWVDLLPSNLGSNSGIYDTSMCQQWNLWSFLVHVCTHQPDTFIVSFKSMNDKSSLSHINRIYKEISPLKPRQVLAQSLALDVVKDKER